MEKIIQLALNGRSVVELVTEFEPSEQTIRNWIQQADIDGGYRNDGLNSEEKQEAIQWLTTEKLSPKQISGRWTVQGIDGMSHEAVYQWIWRGKAQNDPATKELYKHLKHGR